MVGVALQAIMWVAVQESIQYSTKVTTANWVILSLPVRSILESWPISGWPRVKGIAISLLSGGHQAGVCYYIHLHVDMGVQQLMYTV